MQDIYYLPAQLEDEDTCWHGRMELLQFHVLTIFSEMQFQHSKSYATLRQSDYNYAQWKLLKIQSSANIQVIMVKSFSLLNKSCFCKERAYM